jgi:transposase
MHTVELYAQVRRLVMVDGHSQRAVARDFGLSRPMVRKMLQHAMPPGYRRTCTPRRPKIEPFLGWIEATLVADKSVHRKQRHTAQKLFDRLRAEHGYTGGYTLVKNTVRDYERRTRELFVPLVHPPGDAQVDFGEARVVIDGVEQKGHFLAMVLPHSDAPFVEIFPTETTEAFCQGHVDAFAFFDGVPKSILYDNTTIAVARILADGTRKRTQVFDQLASHYLFRDRFARVATGNDKGNVEGLVKWTQRTLLTPIPHAASWEDLNTQLRERCLARRGDRIRGNPHTIGERFVADQSALLPLPSAPFACCRVIPGRVSSQSLVRLATNDYSVPVAYGHSAVFVKAFVHDVVICAGTTEIARHRRSYEREVMICDPLHYLPLIERKPGSLDQAAPLAGWILPDEFLRLRRLLDRRLGKRGVRDYIAVLRLHEGFRPDQVHDAVCTALRLGAISYDAVKQCLLAALDGRPAKLNLDQYPHLPIADVTCTNPAAYNQLCEEALP